ncbi:unnamed protein product [Rhizophagus irregularis]|nr:unnamed protein product [Rhizophagus irregularis]
MLVSLKQLVMLVPLGNSSCCGCSWCISVVDMIVDEVAIAVAAVAVVVVAAAAVVIIVVIAVAVVVGHIVHIRALIFICLWSFDIDAIG